MNTDHWTYLSRLNLADLLEFNRLYSSRAQERLEVNRKNKETLERDNTTNKTKRLTRLIRKKLQFCQQK
jgi:hypothetical protein